MNKQTYNLNQATEYINKCLTLEEKEVLHSLNKVEQQELIARVVDTVRKHMEVVA